MSQIRLLARNSAGAEEKSNASMMVGSRDVANAILTEGESGYSSENMSIQRSSLYNGSCSQSSRGDTMIRQKREYHPGRTQYIVHWTCHTQLNSATCGFAKDIGMEEGMFMTLSIEYQKLFRVGGWLRIQSLVQLVDAMTISPVDNVGISDC